MIERDTPVGTIVYIHRRATYITPDSEQMDAVADAHYLQTVKDTCVLLWRNDRRDTLQADLADVYLSREEAAAACVTSMRKLIARIESHLEELLR